MDHRNFTAMTCICRCKKPSCSSAHSVNILYIIMPLKPCCLWVQRSQEMVGFQPSLLCEVISLDYLTLSLVLWTRSWNLQILSNCAGVIWSFCCFVLFLNPVMYHKMLPHLFLWDAAPCEEASFRSSHDTITCLPVKHSKQVCTEYIITCPICCFPCPHIHSIDFDRLNEWLDGQSTDKESSILLRCNTQTMRTRDLSALSLASC